MELEDLKPEQFVNCPPLMPWRQFAVWIRMEEDQDRVRGWIDKGYLPTLRMGRHRMVNVVLVVKQLLEQEDF